MKRFLGLTLAVIFVLSFAALASAQDVKLTGEIKIWNWYRDNMSVGNTLSTNAPTATASQAFSMTRVRLGVDIKISDNVKGMVELESSGINEVTGAAHTGAAAGADTADFYGWGSLNAKQASVNFRQAWILYTGSGLLGVPAGLKIGHMPLMLGHGKFFNNTRYGDDAIVVFADPNKQLHLGVLTFKAFEYTMADPNAASTSDVDVYAVVVTYKLDDKNSIGVNYSRVNDPDSTVNLRRLQNLMLHATGEVGGFGYKAEADYQSGALNEAGLKAGGSGAFLEVSKKLDPVNKRMSYARGSGDNNAADNKNKSFIVFLGPDMNVAWIYEYQ
ncbi:MAG: alginate export family protein, partial [Nitrospirae bacterium]|nr:alginate export family protein [Nitrospirota bacterium]